MQKTALLKEMFLTFSDSFQNRQNSDVLQRNYEKQKTNYSRVLLFCEGEENLNSLVCARCLISATRSLLSSGYENGQENSIYAEISAIKPLFSESRLKKKELSRFIEDRINAVATMKSDEMTDAVLFTYLSLLEGE